MNLNWTPPLNLTSRKFLEGMIRVLKETKERIDLPIEMEERMIGITQIQGITQTPEIDKGKKEALPNPPDSLHAITRGTEATGLIPGADFRGILLVKITEEKTLEEEISENLPEKIEADQIPETGLEIHPNLPTEGHLLKTVLIVEIGRVMIEMVVVVEVYLEKDKEIEEKVGVKKEEDKVGKV